MALSSSDCAMHKLLQRMPNMNSLSFIGNVFLECENMKMWSVKMGYPEVEFHILSLMIAVFNVRMIMNTTIPVIEQMCSNNEYYSWYQ